MVGTANLVYPDACLKVCEGIEQYMKRHGLRKIDDITGKLILNS